MKIMNGIPVKQEDECLDHMFPPEHVKRAQADIVLLVNLGQDVADLFLLV